MTVQLIDTTAALSALALSNNALRAFLLDGQTHLHLFGSAECPSTMFVRGTGVIALHRPDPRAVCDLMRAYSPVARLLQGFDKLCGAFVGFTLDSHARPVIRAHGATPLAQRELSAFGVEPLTSVEAQALRDKLARVTKHRNSARRRAPRGH